MFIATCETRNFTFTALGKTGPEAYRNIVRGLDTHRKQYVLPEGWAMNFDIDVKQIPEGGCLRDGELLPSSR